MPNIMKIIFALIILLVTGCVANEPKPQLDKSKIVACPDDRPVMCTMQHDPVCGILLDGSQNEYSNSCMACASRLVAGYVPGVCPPRR